jgi:hypothetical protein
LPSHATKAPPKSKSRESLPSLSLQLNPTYGAKVVPPLLYQRSSHRHSPLSHSCVSGQSVQCGPPPTWRTIDQAGSKQLAGGRGVDWRAKRNGTETKQLLLDVSLGQSINTPNWKPASTPIPGPRVSVGLGEHGRGKGDYQKAMAFPLPT